MLRIAPLSVPVCAPLRYKTIHRIVLLYASCPLGVRLSLIIRIKKERSRKKLLAKRFFCDKGAVADKMKAYFFNMPNQKANCDAGRMKSRQCFALLCLSTERLCLSVPDFAPFHGKTCHRQLFLS